MQIFHVAHLPEFWTGLKKSCREDSVGYYLTNLKHQMANLGNDALKAVHNKEYEVTSLKSRK